MHHRAKRCIWTDELETKIIGGNSTVGLLANYVNRRCDNFTVCWNARIPSCVEVLLARMLPTLGSVHTSSCAHSSIHTILYSSMCIRKKYAKKETRGRNSRFFGFPLVRKRTQTCFLLKPKIWWCSGVPQMGTIHDSLFLAGLTTQNRAVRVASTTGRCELHTSCRVS